MWDYVDFSAKQNWKANALKNYANYKQTNFIYFNSYFLVPLIKDKNEICFNANNYRPISVSSYYNWSNTTEHKKTAQYRDAWSV